MSADTLSLLDPSTPDTWPQGILAAADLREQRAKAATPGPWAYEHTGQKDNSWGIGFVVGDDDQPLVGLLDPGQGEVVEPVATGEDNLSNATHIAAEANPAHALAAVRRWRYDVQAHTTATGITEGDRESGPEEVEYCEACGALELPCEPLTLLAAEARAYLGGAS